MDAGGGSRAGRVQGPYYNLMPDDSGVIHNGTKLWVSRGKPIAAVVIILAPVFMLAGMEMQTIKHLEQNIIELKRKVNTLERNAVNKVLIEAQVSEAKTFAIVAENKCTLLRAELVANGTL